MQIYCFQIFSCSVYIFCSPDSLLTASSPIVRWVLDSVSSKSCTSFPAHCDSCLGTSPEKASGTRRPSGPSGHFHFPFGIVDGVADVISRHFFHDGSSSRSGGHIGSPIRNTVTIRETDGRTHFATLRRLIIDYFFEMFFIDFTKLFSLSQSLF